MNNEEDSFLSFELSDNDPSAMYLGEDTIMEIIQTDESSILSDGSSPFIGTEMIDISLNPKHSDREPIGVEDTFSLPKTRIMLSDSKSDNQTEVFPSIWNHAMTEQASDPLVRELPQEMQERGRTAAKKRRTNLMRSKSSSNLFSFNSSPRPKEERSKLRQATTPPPRPHSRSCPPYQGTFLYRQVSPERKDLANTIDNIPSPTYRTEKGLPPAGVKYSPNSTSCIEDEELVDVKPRRSSRVSKEELRKILQEHFKVSTMIEFLLDQKVFTLTFEANGKPYLKKMHGYEWVKWFSHLDSMYRGGNYHDKFRRYWDKVEKMMLFVEDPKDSGKLYFSYVEGNQAISEDSYSSNWKKIWKLRVFFKMSYLQVAISPERIKDIIKGDDSIPSLNYPSFIDVAGGFDVIIADYSKNRLQEAVLYMKDQYAKYGAHSCVLDSSEYCEISNVTF